MVTLGEKPPLGFDFTICTVMVTVQMISRFQVGLLLKTLQGIQETSVCKSSVALPFGVTHKFSVTLQFRYALTMIRVTLDSGDLAASNCKLIQK